MGVADFIARRTTSAPDGSCLTGDIKVGSSIDDVVRAIRSTIGDNVTCLAICAVVVIVTGVVVWYVAKTLVSAISEWRRHQAPQGGGVRGRAPGSGDDVAPYPSASVFDDEMPTGVNESAAVAYRMKKIKVKYGAYNKAITRHAAKNGMEPDDIIDRRILSRADDDFSYGREDTTRRFRKTGQERTAASDAKLAPEPKYGVSA